MNQILERAKYWLSKDFDPQTRQAVQALISKDTESLKESFYQDLQFGTGGMRGIMGVGTNRINKYTLGKNTQGIANYLKEVFPTEALKAVIAYDCRHHSEELAQLVAHVFSANQIRVFLFSALRPTPELSFAVRQLNCQCGIVLTASHNPPEYNGYKVYWKDGGQLVPPEDKAVIQHIQKVDFKDILFSPAPDLITPIGQEIDDTFLKVAVASTAFGVSRSAKADLKIAFTSLHGTSITLAPKALEKAGFTKVHIVTEQADPNGDFPTVKSPNPEEPEALKMVLKLAEEKQADIAIGTDPDADRLGIAVRDLNGKMKLLNGNQTMVLLTDYLLKKWKEKGFNGNEFIASTIVSTPLMKELGKSYAVECKLGLTGFKWIAKMIKDHPQQKFIGGGEESFGYMVGDAVRDKDSISSLLLACEMAAEAKAQGKTLYQKLIHLYKEHGLYQERLVALVKEGIKGAKEIEEMMKGFRQDPPQSISNLKVKHIEDYLLSKKTNLFTQEEEQINLPSSNVLIFHLEDGSRIAVRPSGTEPKIKFYISTHKKLVTEQDFDRIQNELNQKIDDLVTAFGV